MASTSKLSYGLASIVAALALSQSVDAQVTIIRTQGIGAPPATAGGGNLPAIFNAAADWWEATLCTSPYTVTLTYQWGPLGGSTLGLHTLQTQGGSPNRETAGTLTFDNDGSSSWFCDPTPCNHAEYSTGPTFSSSSTLGGGLINTGHRFTGGTGSALGTTDLFSVCLHEIGHALGLSSGNTSFVAGNGDFDVDVTAPRPFAGAAIPTVSGAHLNLPNALMFPGIVPGERRLPSEADAVSNAQISQMIGIASVTDNPDLWVKDGDADNGSEPSAVPYPWTSPSIWVRNAFDGGLDHQNPIAGAANYVYVRVRNRSSCQQAPPTLVEVRWAKASSGLSWPTPWYGLPLCSGIAPMGGSVGPAVMTPTIPPGGTAIISFTWTVPIPSDYSSCDADQTHFCLLARVLEPMTMIEGSDLGANVLGNNNICWRNVTVVGDGAGSTGFVMLSNYTPLPRLFRARIDLGAGMQTPLPVGALQWVVPPAMMATWLLGGSSSYGVALSPNAANTFEVLQDGAWLGNLAMAPNEHLTFEILLHEDLPVSPGQDLVINVLQQLEGTPPLTVGGQQFVARAGAVLAPVGTNTFGTSCAGTLGISRNTALVRASIGTNWQGQITNLPMGVALVIYSLSPPPMPFPLDLLGMTGCNLYVPLASTEVVLGSPTGNAIYGLPIPNQPSLLGIRVHTQGAVLDALANPFGFTTTNALSATIVP